jgi:hypothetical protein
MSDAGKNAWCREHGVYPAETERPIPRRPARRPRGPTRKRIKELERELLRGLGMEKVVALDPARLEV